MSFLTFDAVTLKFGGVTAVNNLSFAVAPGSVFALVGPNGAGKSTVFNLISRFYRPVTGEIRFDGQNLLDRKPSQVASLGIARTFQNNELFDHSTVLENLLIGRHRHRGTNFLSELFFTPSVRRQELQNRDMVEAIIDFLDLQPYREMTISGLPYGVRKVVELGRALATGQGSCCSMNRPRACRWKRPATCGGGSTTSAGRWGSPC